MKAFCPECGEFYEYDHFGREQCGCNRKHEYLEEFIKIKGLEKEFNEFLKEREKHYWKKWLLTLFKTEKDVNNLVETIEDVSDKITEYLTPEEIKQTIADAILKHNPNRITLLAEYLESIFNIKL